MSAIVAEGWTYNQIRGSLRSYVLGSPDAFRQEPWRATRSIDDAYMDGVAISRWSAAGRTHVASYAAGTSYSARQFSFYLRQISLDANLHTNHRPHAHTFQVAHTDSRIPLSSQLATVSATVGHPSAQIGSAKTTFATRRYAVGLAAPSRPSNR